MPTNHGIYRKLPTERMAFRFGILQIFEALKTGSFLPTPDEWERAAQIEHHFRTLCPRFVFTLQHLNGLMQELVQCYSHGQVSFASMQIRLHAECLADNVLTYLNTIVDDVAIATVLATGFTSAGLIDNMAKLRSSEVRNDPALAPVKTLLDDLDQPGSWWELAFKQKQGARQLLVHNHHLVGFQVSSAPGGPFEVRAVVTSPFAQKTLASRDFFGLLRNILSNIFDWLDRLEVALTAHLRTKSVGWTPMPTCSWFFLPVGHPPGITRYDPEYFPIPLCDGADPLPWTASFPIYTMGENAPEQGQLHRVGGLRPRVGARDVSHQVLKIVLHWLYNRF